MTGTSTATEETEGMRTGIDRLHDAVTSGLAKHGIALMSHAVVGYPSLEHNARSIAALCDAGAELMELQFPFSDPIADGAVLANANQKALDTGIRIRDMLTSAAQTTARHPSTAFVIMTYANIVFRHGCNLFIGEVARTGVAGLIIPDLPPERAYEYREACRRYGLGTVFLVTPDTSEARADEVVSASSGFVYCVARPGVTGGATRFTDDVLARLRAVKSASPVPLGVGFGIRTSDDVARLRGVVDIAIICTEVIRRIDADGIDPTATYLAGLRDGLGDAAVG
jgi:tryptophan synthase alpha chain